MARKTAIFRMTVASLMAGVTLAGCHLIPGSGKVNWEEFTNIPPGRLILIQRDYEAAKDSQARDVILRHARAENSFVNRLFVDHVRVKEKNWQEKLKNQDKELDSYVFLPDGTYSERVKNRALHKFSGASKWRLGRSKIEMCWEESCEYYSSWSVHPHFDSPEHMEYVFTLEGLPEDDGSYSFSLYTPRTEEDGDWVYDTPDYVAPVFDDDGKIVKK